MRISSNSPEIGEAEETIPADPTVRNYSYTLVDGELYYRETSVMYKPELPRTSVERARDMVGLRDLCRAVIDAQMAGVSDEGLQVLQKNLDQDYDRFVRRHGRGRGGVRASGLDELPAEASRDVRVYPFLGAASQWGQKWPFNEYTTFRRLNIHSPDVKPTMSDDEVYPVGCTALATAQALHAIMTNGGFDFTGVPRSRWRSRARTNAINPSSRR